MKRKTFEKVKKLLDEGYEIISIMFSKEHKCCEVFNPVDIQHYRDLLTFYITKREKFGKNSVISSSYIYRLSSDTIYGVEFENNVVITDK